MPRLFVGSQDLVGSRLNLGGDAHRYLTRVLRLRPTATVDLYDGTGLEVAATLESIGAREVTLVLGARRQVNRRPSPPVTLLQGLPRAERMDLVVQKATELGAGRVIPVRTERTASGQQGKPERWNKIAIEAARQCGRPQLPEISPLSSLADAIAALDATATRVVPWEEAPTARPLRSSIPAAPAGIAALIGPEGGLTRDEVELATANGFEVVTLGPRILRTETAAIAVLAIIQSLVGALD